MRVPAHRSPGSARHRVATLAANQVAGHWADIARHISSRLLPSVTRAGIAASSPGPPWRASRRQPGELDRIGPVDTTCFPAASPQVRFNALATEWERSEQTGIATLMKGLFSTFRNPAAHAPRVAWATSRSDAPDMLTLASMLHRRLDKADVRQAVP